MSRQFLHEQIARGDDFAKLKEKVVVLAGCGAIGSWAGNFLARMGVQNFRLIDKDRVEEHNVSTQTFTPANVGQYKTRALQEQLYRISKARCELHPVELTEKNGETLLRSCDIIICSFDNHASRMLVKDASIYPTAEQLYDTLQGRGPVLSYPLKNPRPCIFAGMNGQESYFEIVWAENYKVPPDAEQAEVDPCAYPLSTPLVTCAAALTAEIAVHYLLTGKKKECRLTLNQTGSLIFG